MTLRGIASEPLVHFLLLGAALFGAYGWLNRHGFSAPDEILVSRSQVDGLALQFENVWQRPPTSAERQALIDNWVRDEILYREALAMGLDQGDPVVRRRLSQKIQFIIESGTPAAPSDAELQGWLEEHANDYRIDTTYAIQQVYFDPSKHGGRLTQSIASARRALAIGRQVEGDSTMLPRTLEGSASEVIRTFGSEFEESLRALPIAEWAGPVRSAFGVHLVRLATRNKGRPSRLDEMRAEVERDWARAHSQQAQDAYYERLRAKYAVRIESENPAPAG